MGRAENAQVRLFDGHGVHKDVDYWIYRECFTSGAARRVQQCLITTYQTDGGLGDLDDKSRFVYAYKKEPHTRDEGGCVP